MPSPENARSIDGPIGPGVYQLKQKSTGQFILFGIGVECRKRMKSLFPEPYGTGERRNDRKRSFVLSNWKDLEYRTLQINSRGEAKEIEDRIKDEHNHLFNT